MTLISFGLLSPEVSTIYFFYQSHFPLSFCYSGCIPVSVLHPALAEAHSPFSPHPLLITITYFICPISFYCHSFTLSCSPKLINYPALAKALILFTPYLLFFSFGVYHIVLPLCYSGRPFVIILWCSGQQFSSVMLMFEGVSLCNGPPPWISVFRVFFSYLFYSCIRFCCLFLVIQSSVKAFFSEFC